MKGDSKKGRRWQKSLCGGSQEGSPIGGGGGG